jgi:hypothetical protein
MLQKLETELKLRGVSPQTVKTYLYYNQRFLDFIKKQPEAISEDDIKSYLANLLSERNVSNSTWLRQLLLFITRRSLAKT